MSPRLFVGLALALLAPAALQADPREQVPTASELAVLATAFAQTEIPAAFTWRVIDRVKLRCFSRGRLVPPTRTIELFDFAWTDESGRPARLFVVPQGASGQAVVVEGVRR
jgi:hypothetical protein